MRTLIDRRYLLKMTTAVPLAWALRGIDAAWSQSGATDEPSAIDVHCHVFNASDVPVRGFVQRVVFGDEEDQVIFDPEPAQSRALVPYLGAVVVRIMAGGAPTASEELQDMETAGRSLVASRTLTSPVSVKRIADALESVLEDPESSMELEPRARSRASDEGRSIFREKILERTRVGPAARSAPRERSDYEASARSLLSGTDALSRYVQFAEWMTGDRRRLLGELLRLYGGDGKVLLFTPALVDFSGWLDEEQRSDLESQIVLVERMQRMNLGTPVHFFVGFNPWRQVKDLETGKSPTALELVKNAVEEMGFVGVKLYPPMGFLPAGNAGSGLTYPERAAEIPDFPKKIDAALDALYGWAAEQGVAVMAHATNSQGAGEGYSLRARPDRWAPVLAKYPALNLNLAHFGRFDEAGDTLDETWEYLLGKLGEGRSGKTFADMSYLNEVLPEGTMPTRRATLVNYLRAFVQRYDPNCERLMYGSDWAMLLREAKYQNYLDSFRSYIAELQLTEAARSRLYRDNAVAFLGLRKDAPARVRLEAYYAKHGLDSSWLSQLDQ